MRQRERRHGVTGVGVPGEVVEVPQVGHRAGQDRGHGDGEQPGADEMVQVMA
jgi:hypothetical protein